MYVVGNLSQIVVWYPLIMVFICVLLINPYSLKLGSACSLFQTIFTVVRRRGFRSRDRAQSV